MLPTSSTAMGNVCLGLGMRPAFRRLRGKRPARFESDRTKHSQQLGCRRLHQGCAGQGDMRDRPCRERERGLGRPFRSEGSKEQAQSAERSTTPAGSATKAARLSLPSDLHSSRACISGRAYRVCCYSGQLSSSRARSESLWTISLTSRRVKAVAIG